jgi:hypothetical protein
VLQNGDSTRLVVRAPVRVDLPRSFIELEIDLKRDAAIVRHSTSMDGNITRQINVDWSHGDAGWMPESWTMVNYRGDGELFMSTEAKVLAWDCSADLSEIEFQYEVKSGEKYLDEVTNRMMVKSSGEQADMPLELHEIRESAAERRWWWMASALLVVCLGGAAFWWRRSSLQ